MKAQHILDALEEIDDRYILTARQANSATQKRKIIRRAFLIAAVLVAALALCGFAIQKFGFFDLWHQTPSEDPTQTVRSAIENQIDKEYTLQVRIEEIKVDEAETKRFLEVYTGSEYAQSQGWTDEYLAKHFVAVQVRYYVEYDHTKTFQRDGDLEQTFYLTQDAETGKWTIFDNTSPTHPEAEPSLRISQDCTEVVRRELENQNLEAHTQSIRIDEIKVDEAETERFLEVYTGSEYALSQGWTDEYLAEHFAAVRAWYYVEYDHTKTFLPDGNTEQIFYLTQDANTNLWTIFDCTSPAT